MIIYKVTNKINGKSYIGQTIRDLSIRKRNHLLYTTNEKYYKKYRCKFYEAIRKYGRDEFDWSIICECKTIEELNEKEKFFIKEFDSYGDNGYNLTDGGFNFNRSQETKEKYSKIHKGKIISDDQKKKLSESLKGRIFTDEHIKNMSISQKGKEKTWLKGKKLSDETKKKMSLAQVGNKNGVGNKSWTGKKRTDETIKKIKESCEGMNSKPINRYDLDGNYIDTWKNADEYSKSINRKRCAHISCVCIGKRKNAYGYIWKYKK